MTSWSYTFGGQAAQPAQVSYVPFTLSADTTLEWPWVDQSTSTETALIMDVTASSGSLSLTMPPATSASVGQTILISNVGANSFTVKKNDGTSIVTINSSLSYYIYITDNSTDAGSWRYVQFGAGASSVDAAALDGYGLVAAGSVLNQNHPVRVIVANTTVASSDRASMITVSPAIGSGTLTLPLVSANGDGFFFIFSNLGTGAWTVSPSGGQTIDNVVSISINPNETLEIHQSGAAWYTLGRGRSTQFAFTMLNYDIHTGTSFTLSSTEAGNFIIRFFGALAGNTTVNVPAAVQPYIVYNNTTGAFSLTFQASGGTGIVVPQSNTVWLYCDGTNVLDADTVGTAAAALAMPDGTFAAPGLAFTNDVDTGIFAPASGSNRMGFAAGGANVGEVNSTGLDINGQNMLMRWRGADIFALAAAFS